MLVLARILALLLAQDAASRIDAVVGPELEGARIPGASIALARDGKIVLSKGYGKALLGGDGVEPRTVFRIGSITKQFTGAAVLLLRDDGKLALDDPLSKFLPDYPRGGEITVRHLLHHTSGIRSFTDLKEYRAAMAEDRTADQMIALFRGQPMGFEPGEKFAYNNSGYFLLGVIIEKASGSTLGDFLKARVFDPLEMKSTRVDGPKVEAAHRAAGYKRANQEWREADPISMTQPGAAGAMISTAEDLLRWDLALHGGKVLGRESLEEMLSPGRLKDGKSTGYGCGIFVRGEGDQRTIEHGGGINGFVSYLGRAPARGPTVAVLVNREGYDAKGLAGKVAKAFLGE